MVRVTRKREPKNMDPISIAATVTVTAVMTMMMMMTRRIKLMNIHTINSTIAVQRSMATTKAMMRKMATMRMMMTLRDIRPTRMDPTAKMTRKTATTVHRITRKTSRAVEDLKNISATISGKTKKTKSPTMMMMTNLTPKMMMMKMKKSMTMTKKVETTVNHPSMELDPKHLSATKQIMVIPKVNPSTHSMATIIVRTRRHPMITAKDMQIQFEPKATRHTSFMLYTRPSQKSNTRTTSPIQAEHHPRQPLQMESTK